MDKTMLILANSVKHHEHCIAGKDLKTKKWIRPVATDQGAELKTNQIKFYKNSIKIECKPLDIAKITFLKECPLQHQPENMLVSDENWGNVKPYKLTNIPEELLDSPKTIWGKGNSISHDDIEKGNIKILQSLFLIKVTDLRLYQNRFEGRPKRRASFHYNNNDYNLPATDPNFDFLFDNDIVPKQNILCISLGENFNRNHYKLIAGIF